MKNMTVTALLLLLCSCDRVAKPKQPEEPSPFPTPTASELFELQSKCTALGEKVLQNSMIGNALTQEQVSRYNPKDNRCYVKLSVSTADLTTPRERFLRHDYLDDGQSGEMLAYSYDDGSKKSCMVFDSSLKKLMQEKKQSQFDCDAISELIDSFVETDRRL